MSEIKNLNPEAVWRNFDAICQVPHPSGHLKQIQQFFLDFAASCGVEAFIDKGNNVVMRKPATPGMEDKKGVILQAHMDMVPQKLPDSKHNFETDALSTYIDGEWVKAQGTTLGSDNGIGVAAIMAIMEAKDIKHGLIEGLITADEETGMFGANALPEGELQGDILINLDTEKWGEFIIGSAGGLDITASLEYKEVETCKEDVALKVTLKGLRGGHSGLEIHEGRGNANKLMARFVHDAILECEARLATWHGGNMRNAIPFFAEAVITLPKENMEDVKSLVKEWEKEFQEEYKGIESGIELSAEEVETPATEMPEDIQDNVLDAIYACHNGVLRMIPAVPEVVETSSNLAIINIENGKAYIAILARSSHEGMKSYIATTLESCFNMAGMKVEFSGGYVGWDPNPNSEILQLLKRLYKEQNNEDAIVQVDHAGLECSVILGKYPHLSVVSFGPTIKSPHTTNERCLISSVEPFWDLLKLTLAEIPAK